jgi:glutathione S-transferase
MPAMKLIYHPLSPFSRKVYILALELGLADQITLEKVVVAPVFYPGWSDKYFPLLFLTFFSFLHSP